MRLGAHPMTSAPDPAADWGSAGGSTTAAGSEPPGLRRSHAGHPPTSWPYPEQHRQHFRSVELGDNGRSFVMAQQLRDACRKWLMAEERDVKDVVDLVGLEQFIAWLPRGTAEWVQCHRRTSLAQTIQLAEDHLVACPGVSEPLLNLSLSNPSPSLSALSRPIPAPRSRSNAPPRTPQQGSAFQGNRSGTRGGVVESAGAAAPSPPFSSLRQSLGHTSAAGAAGKPGPACWRCRARVIFRAGVR